MLNITQIIYFLGSDYYIEKRRLIIIGSMVRAHLGPLNNQPLTIYFVGGFFFGASFLPGFGGKVGGNLHLSWFCSYLTNIQEGVNLQ